MVNQFQCKAARVWLGWGQRELASKAGVALKTVTEFEKGSRVPHDNTASSIQKVFENEGFEFLEDESGRGIGLVRKADI